MNIIYAAENGNVEECRQHLANADALECESALEHAAERGNFEVCKLLIEHNTRIGSQALNLAAINGHLEICKLLLEHGAGVHDVVLYFAAYYKEYEICKLLLEHGANLRVLFTKKGYPMQAVYKVATKEQIKQARNELKIKSVMES